jgi:NAD(P)-dependent dehydrogenase (short-subunit alcohol dehydrogenase family)
MAILEGKVAIVTGSGQGIGKALAIGMAKEGAKVVTNNRRPGADGGDAETTAKEIKELGGEAVPFFGDISKFDEAERLIKTAMDNFGTVHILINSGGADSPRMVWNMTEEDWDKSVDSYLKGTFNCTRHAAGIMRQQRWGRIISMASDAFLGTIGHANYGAAKGGIVSFTRSIARELGRYSVTCNAICPEAATRFSMDPAVAAGFKKRYEAGLITKAELDRALSIPSPDYMAPIINYLATEEAGNINGQVIFIAGNHIAIYSIPVRVRSIFKPEGKWTQAELANIIPKTISLGLVNPAPPEEKKKE